MTKSHQELKIGSASPSKTIDYIGEFVFENSALDYLLHEEEDKPSRNSPVDCFRFGPGCRVGKHMQISPRPEVPSRNTNFSSRTTWAISGR
ncbi:hypothetical protein [Negadavirga shengliensis]|uniref:Uncharacterized protein n=1 Tax=Negadavirga shengliensis TaxID=1389218 RepID=A0ABV9T7B0_9BACT